MIVKNAEEIGKDREEIKYLHGNGGCIAGLRGEQAGGHDLNLGILETEDLGVSMLY